MPSTVISRFVYDRERRALAVTFVSGRCYLYHDVPAQVAADMQAAFAKGEYFNRHVRGRYRHERLDEAKTTTRLKE